MKGILIPLSLLVLFLIPDLFYTRGAGFDFGFTEWFADYRLPRVLTAVLAGLALSASGLALQTLFRNPLAGPFVTGITPGAAFAVGVVLLVFPSGLTGWVSQLGITGAGMAGGIAVLLLQLLISRRSAGIFTLLLSGVMLSYLLGAGVEIMQSFARAENLRSFIMWGLGSFDGVTTRELSWSIPLVLCGVLALVLLRYQLDAWLPGELFAKSSGIHTKRLKLQVILLTGLLAGAITAMCGPVGFVGLAAPHLARLHIKTALHGKLLFPVLLWGVTLCVGADLLAHNLIEGQVLNINAICALMGAPVVLWVLLRRPTAM